MSISFKELHPELAQEEAETMSNIPTQQTFSESNVREIICERDKEWFQIIESIFNFHPISMTEALKIGIDRMKNKNERIKQLEESENRMLNWLTEDCPESVKKQLSNAWMKSKETKP
jgi:uncharacterized protein YbaR (Trm112 family)